VLVFLIYPSLWGHNYLWRSHAYSLGSASTGAGRFAERASEMIDSPPQP
jgi:hypothetical protein